MKNRGLPPPQTGAKSGDMQADTIPSPALPTKITSVQACTEQPLDLQVSLSLHYIYSTSNGVWKVRGGTVQRLVTHGTTIPKTDPLMAIKAAIRSSVPN